MYLIAIEAFRSHGMICYITCMMTSEWFTLNSWLVWKAESEQNGKGIEGIRFNAAHAEKDVV